MELTHGTGEAFIFKASPAMNPTVVLTCLYFKFRFLSGSYAIVFSVCKCFVMNFGAPVAVSCTLYYWCTSESLETMWEKMLFIINI